MRRSSRILFPLLAVALAAAFALASPVVGRDRDDPHPKDRFDAGRLEGAAGWERVWCRFEAEAGLKPFDANGDLLLWPDAVEFIDRRKGWRIPFESIAAVDFGRLPGDPDIDWVVLTTRDGEPADEVALRDGKRFGFGRATREMYARLAESLEAAGAAQWSLPEGRALFDALEHQLRLTYPESWSVYAVETDFRDGVNAAGTVILDPGRGPGIRLVRRIDPDRDRCDGMPEAVVADLRVELASSRAFLDGAVAADDVQVEPIEIDGCRGVRLHGAAGDKTAELFAVSRRGTRFLFAAVGMPDAMAVLGPELRRIVDGVRWPRAHKAPARP